MERVAVPSSGAGKRSADQAPLIESLVVLPLDNLSGDPNQEYFVEGMHEAIISELSRLGTFMVISRTSAKCYQHTTKPVPQIARELNVDAVVEGSVLRAEDRVRITLQLVEGCDDRHLWSQSYERDLRDVLALQREVAQAVAGEIRTATSPAERGRSEAVARPEGTQHPNSKAYDTFLKGRYHFARYGEGSLWRLRSTISSRLSQKIRHSPQPMQLSRNALVNVAWFSPDKLSLARENAERAVALDPFLPEGHAALGFVLNQEWNWQRSEAEFKRAIELDPNSSTAHQWYAQLLRDLMRNDEALREAPARS